MAVGVSRTGDDQNNTIVGSDGDDALIGLAGDDRLEALSGSDSVDAGPGNDWIALTDDGSGDRLNGGDGWDNLEIRMSGSSLTLATAVPGIEAIAINPSGASRTKTVTLRDEIFDPSQSNKYVDVWGDYSFRIDGESIKSGHSILFQGSRGDDTFIGGAGDDWVRYYFGVVNFSDLKIVGDSTAGWILRNGQEDLLKLSRTTGSGAWTIQDLRKSLAANSNAFGTDTVSGIERLELNAQESTGNGYRIAYLDLAGAATSQALSLLALANRGTAGNDSIVGAAADDQIYGLTGSDTILGLAGNDNITIADDGSTDQIDGGEGWDNLTVRADAGPVILGNSIRNIENINLDPGSATTSRKITVLDAVFGDRFDRLNLNCWGNVGFEVDGSGLSAAHRLDNLNGSNANDTLRGGGGNDYFWGWQGDDVLVGGAGEDKAAYQFGVFEFGKLSVVENGARRWTLKNGADALLELQYDAGTARWLVSDARKFIAQNSSFFGVDTLDGIEQVDLHAQDAETLGYFAGFIQLGVSAGLPTVLLGGSANRGTVGNDSLVGTAADDQIYGLKGSDTILGLAGNDSITIADDGSSDQIDGGEGWDNLTIRLGGGSIELGSGIRRIESFGFAAEASTVSTKVNILDSVFAGGGDQIFLNVWDGTEVTIDFSAIKSGPTVFLNPNRTHSTFVGGAVNSVLLLPSLDNAGFKISDYKIDVAIDGASAVITSPLRAELRIEVSAVKLIGSSTAWNEWHSLSEYIDPLAMAQQGLVGTPTQRWNANAPVGTATRVSFSFVQTAPADGSGKLGFRAFTEAERAMVRDILTKTAALAGLNFTEVNESAGTVGQIRFGVSQQSQTKGVTVPPSIIDPSGSAGDVWMDVESMVQLAPGSEGYAALLHEIGHALGLRHPRNYDSTDHWTAQFRVGDDRTAITVMAETPSVDGEFRADWGPLDIAALRYLYGTQSIAQRDSHYLVGGNDAAAQRSIVDDAGLDTLDASASPVGVLLDLQPGHLSSVGISNGGFSSQENLGIAPGTWIENAVGSPGDDVVFGNSLDNRLQGLAGNDWLDGLGGADTAVFNVRRDQVLISTGYGNVYVSGRDGSSGFDTLVNIEQIEFSDQIVQLSRAASGRDYEITIDEDGQIDSTLPDPSDQPRAGVVYTVVEGPFHGKLTLTSAGGFIFVPTADFSGNDRFIFQIKDSSGNSNKYNYYIDVSPVNDLPTGSLTIDGVASRGRTLQAKSTLADVDGLGPFSYQWNADGVAIAGATLSEYLLSAQDAGKAITVTGSYTDSLGTVESVTSSPTGKVAALNAAPTGAVVITGLATEGQALSATHTIADADGLGPIDTRWEISNDGLSGWADIANAGGSMIAVKAGHVGLFARAVLSYTDGLGLLETVYSAPSHRIGALIVGTTAGDVLKGTAGDDRLEGGLGDDVIQGGAGIDTLVLGGVRKDYTVLWNPAAALHTIASKSEGLDSAASVEFFTFSDGTLSAATLTATRPVTVAVASQKTSLIIGETATLTFTLSESSSDFGVEDITVSGGALSNFLGSGTIYTATFTPAANSMARGIVSVASGKFADATGNVNVDGSETNNTVTFAVNTKVGFNAIPTAESSALTVPEDQSLVLSANHFAFLDSNSSDSLQAVSITTLPSKGALQLSGTAVKAGQSISVADIAAGKLAFTPVANANGAAYAKVGFKVSDGKEWSTASYTLTLNVTADNDAPVFAPTSLAVSGTEDVALKGTVKASDVDTGDKLTYRIDETRGLTLGSVTINAGTGAYVYTPAKNANGADGFVVIATDSAGASATQTVNVLLKPVNDAPVFATPTLTVAAVEDKVLSGKATASDVDSGDTLAYAIKTQGKKGTVTIDAATGAYTYTPIKDANGVDSFVITATDSAKIAATQTVSLTLAAVNDAPIVAKAITTPVSITEGAAFSYSLPAGTFKDVDDTTLTYDATGLPRGVAVDPKTGKLSGTVGYDAADVGSLTVNITATDKAGLSAAMPLTLNLINKPTVLGTAAADRITAGLGNDSLSGAGGNDTLLGGAGDDTLVGGAGLDVLTGGDGADRFVFETILGSSNTGSSNLDTITDFVTGTDKLVLSAKIFSKFTGSSAGSAITAGNLVMGSGATALDSNDYLVYDTTSDLLYYDADGSGTGAPVAFVKVELTGTAASVFADFVVVS